MFQGKKRIKDGVTSHLPPGSIRPAGEEGGGERSTEESERKKSKRRNHGRGPDKPRSTRGVRHRDPLQQGRGILAVP